MQPIIMPLAEVADRYTIALLKLERLPAEDQIALRHQMLHYRAGLPIEDNSTLMDLVDELYTINGLMWDTEFAIRGCQEESLGLEEIGRRALHIRDLNQKRVRIKNQIVELTGSGFRDVKMNYAKPTS